MAYFFSEPSRTFSEYLLVPGYSSAECIPANVSLKTPVVKYRRGEEPALTMNVPMVSAVMQAVSGEQMGIALAKEGGIAFIYVSQPIEQQAEMVRRVKNYKAGFVISDSNLRLGDTLADVLALKERTGHSTMAVTDDGTGTGKLLGLVTSRDYRVSRMDPATPVSEFMTPAEKIVSAPEGTSLKAANDIIWDHKLNALPIVSAGGHLVSFVFRKDYDSHKGNPLELLDSQKRYVVGAGINSRDYEDRVPALVEAGADVLVIASPVFFSQLSGPLLSLLSRLQCRYLDRALRSAPPRNALGVVLLAAGGAAFHLLQSGALVSSVQSGVNGTNLGQDFVVPGLLLLIEGAGFGLAVLHHVFQLSHQLDTAFGQLFQVERHNHILLLIL